MNYYRKEWGDALASPAGALILEGIATTSERLPIEYVQRGVRTAPRRGPYLAEFELPVPLWVSHDPDKVVGEVLWCSGDTDVMRFRAAVRHPETPDGLNPDILRSAWRNLRTRVWRGVSASGPFLTGSIYMEEEDREWIELPGQAAFQRCMLRPWRFTELSVCPRGAYARAVIERVLVPSGIVARETEIVEKGMGLDYIGGAERAIVTKTSREMSGGGFRLDTPADDRVTALEARIATLEKAQATGAVGERFGWEWMGNWRADMHYRRNNQVTRGGSSWICLQDGAQDEPGTGGSGWDLVSRHGRDGARK